MTKWILTACAIILCFTSKSQSTSGHVLYTETIKLKMDLGGMENEEIKKMLPPAQVVKKELLFNATESLFKNAETPKDIDISHEQDGGEFNIVMKVPESTTYMNLKDNAFVQSQDLLGKQFLIVDKLDLKKWKFTGEQKKVLDYMCQKAIYTDSIQTTIVWFAPQISVGIGPNGYNGLPGLVLAVEMDKGDRTLVATSVVLKSIESSSLIKPSKGKQVSRQEYNKLREEKMKEMGATNGGSGMKMIIREERH
jgi:GLPGLI family protein